MWGFRSRRRRGGLNAGQRKEEAMTSYEGRWTTVRVEVEEGIGWVR